jgi:hypothetical protein
MTSPEEGAKTLSRRIRVIMPTTGMVNTMTLAEVVQGSNLYLKKMSQTILA